MFVIRRREDAEGESKMMGSGRLCLWWDAIEGLVATFEDEAFGGFLVMNTAASLRTCEKS